MQKRFSAMIDGGSWPFQLMKAVTRTSSAESGSATTAASVMEA